MNKEWALPLPLAACGVLSYQLSGLNHVLGVICLLPYLLCVAIVHALQGVVTAMRHLHLLQAVIILDGNELSIFPTTTSRVILRRPLLTNLRLRFPLDALDDLADLGVADLPKGVIGGLNCLLGRLGSVL
jgi:hypothetical protein